MPTAPHAVVTIEGSVRDRDGVAMMETYVYFTPEADPSGNFLPSTYVRTDTDGAFKTALAEGSYAVGIDPPNSTGYPEGRVGKFTVDRSKPRFDYRFSGTKVSGSLTGPGGPLLTRAYIQCSDAPYRTTASAVTTGGHYSLFIPPGLYTFAVQPSDNYSGIATTLRLKPSFPPRTRPSIGTVRVYGDGDGHIGEATQGGNRC